MSAGAAPAASGGDAPLVEVEHLAKHFPIARGVAVPRGIGPLRAVDDVSFALRPGETLGLVGESGCGKTTTARLVMRLLEPTAGTIRFEGRDITRLAGRELRALRRRMQMVFQDPYASLNPRHRVGAIIGEPLRIHRAGGDRRATVRELMARVGLDPGHEDRRPHEFSAGQRQRIGIARALALGPRLIVADEPVSALDVSIQAQILNLLKDLQEERRLAYLFISHDLAVVRHVSDRIAVMYLGRLVEVADADRLCDDPRHPYTAALLSAVPRGHRGPTRSRIVLAGDAPSAAGPPAGCPFHPRCPKARLLGGGGAVPEDCRTATPPLADLGGGRRAACWHPVTAGEGLHGAAPA